jgi:hypothetical protein
MMVTTFAPRIRKNTLPMGKPLKMNLLKKTLLLCLAPLVLVSCATRLRIPEELEAERLLPEGALAYLRVNPAMAGDLILPIIEPYGISLSSDMLERTESMVLAVMPPAGDAGGLPGRPVVYGVASGKFPTRSIALKLNTDRQWSRQEPGWVHKDAGFHVALASGGRIIAGTAPLAMVTEADQDRPHPVPEFWNIAWYNDLAVYIPDPASLLAGTLPVDISGLPLESMIVSSRRVEDQHDLFLGFEFATERSAVVFAPLCRLFIYALARGLWPLQSTELLAAVSWSTQGSTVEASGLRLDSLQLASLLALPFAEATQARSGQMDGSK